MERPYGWTVAGHILDARDFFFIGDGMKPRPVYNGSGSRRVQFDATMCV
jgi:hypothetical protein